MKLRRYQKEVSRPHWSGDLNIAGYIMWIYCNKCCLLCSSEERRVLVPRRLSSCPQATAVESPAPVQQNAETGQLQTRRSRSGKRSVERVRTRGDDVHLEGDGDEKQTRGEEGDGGVIMKRGRGRPRKVCSTFVISILCNFLSKLSADPSTYKHLLCCTGWVSSNDWVVNNS